MDNRTMLAPIPYLFDSKPVTLLSSFQLAAHDYTANLATIEQIHRNQPEVAFVKTEYYSQQLQKISIRMLTNLIRTNQYLQEYIGFLIGSYTQEQFDEIAGKYVIPYDDLSEEEYVEAISVLREINKILPINQAQVAEILNVPPVNVGEFDSEG